MVAVTCDVIHDIMHTVNLAIQVLPLHVEQAEAIRIIDVAIARIQQSGLKHVVCPFETVIEGHYPELMQLLDNIQDDCYMAGAETLIINMKLHRSAVKDLHIEDKLEKYS